MTHHQERLQRGLRKGYEAGARQLDKEARQLDRLGERAAKLDPESAASLRAAAAQKREAAETVRGLINGSEPESDTAG